MLLLQIGSDASAQASSAWLPCNAIICNGPTHSYFVPALLIGRSDQADGGRRNGRREGETKGTVSTPLIFTLAEFVEM